MQPVYHAYRLCQVDPNFSPLRDPLAISYYHGDFGRILVTRSSVNIIMVVVLVQFWVWPLQNGFWSSKEFLGLS